MEKPKPHILVIFGASGDLAQRKLIPALFDLWKQKRLPTGFAVLGTGRTLMTDAVFREKMNAFLTPERSNEAFLKLIHYLPMNPEKQADYRQLKERIGTLDQEVNARGNALFYLSTPPSLYAVIPHHLHKAGLSSDPNAFRRLIVEKPFGTDLASAQKLNIELLHYFEESQIYRIDHYLGKETVQNMLVTRFSNGILEPLWNHQYIQRVEITSAESLGVEGRGGYYDNAGALRDMVQNHLMQLAAFVAMEPPTVMEANAIRNELLKVFQALRPIAENKVERHVVRGQYTTSNIGEEKVSGYRNEQGVSENSRTETYAALRFYIDNWRWAGVPFYIRTGKKLPTRVTEVVVHFKEVPHHIFGTSKDSKPVENQLIMRIQPDEGILLRFGMKVPGAGFSVQTVNMDFHYSSLAQDHLPSAYERLLLDCMLGDATLYSRGDTIEAAWKFIQPILNAWDINPEIPLYGYPAGSWGPDVADKLVLNGSWRYPCKNLSDDGTYCEL